MTTTVRRRHATARPSFPASITARLAIAALATTAGAFAGTPPAAASDGATPEDPRIVAAAQHEMIAPPPSSDFERLAPLDRERAWIAVGDDGAPWARGSTYKAHFGSEGAAYVPFVGADAPRAYPVRFALASVAVGGEPLAFERDAVAVLAGDSVRYARGSVVEVYDVGRDTIEQSFVFEELSARGELVLRIAVETELAGRELDDRLEWSNELGAVRYGRATAIDARGATVAAPTVLTEHGIEIRVPADFVAVAELPLVVDPLITTFTIAGGSLDSTSPDCAYDSSNGRWLVVHEERFNASDTDVAWRLVGALNGQTYAWGYLENLPYSRWGSPACANHSAANQFLVVATESGASPGTSRVVGRTISAATGALSGVLEIAPTTGEEIYGLDVGGDPSTSNPANFLIAWSRRVGVGGSADVRFRVFDPNTGGGSSEQVLGSHSAWDTFPSVSKSNDGSVWNVAWNRSPVGYYTQVIGARIAKDGTVAGAPFVVKQDVNDMSGISASTSLNGSSTWVAAYTYYDRWGTTGPFSQDVGVTLIDGVSVIDELNVSKAQELAGREVLSSAQGNTDVDGDGRSFALAYSVNPGGTATNTLKAVTLARVGSLLQLGEDVILHYATFGIGGSRPSVASVEGAGLGWRLEMIAFEKYQTTQYSLTPQSDVLAALYDNGLYASYCFPGQDGVLACPCSNAPSQHGRGCNNPANTGGARLSATGISSVGSDSMGLVAEFLPANQTVFFYQGSSPLSTAVFSGRGVRCVGGTLLNLYTNGSYVLGNGIGYATAPNTGDAKIAARSAALGYPIFAGETRQYYASYRPVGSSGGGSGIFACTNGLSSNTTQAVQAIWIP